MQKKNRIWGASARRRILRMVFTEGQCNQNPGIAKTYERWVAKLWPLLSAQIPDREVKAQQVEAVGGEFIKLWNTATGGGTQHVYPHMLVAHLPDMIRFLPVDPFDCRRTPIRPRVVNPSQVPRHRKRVRCTRAQTTKPTKRRRSRLRQRGGRSEMEVESVCVLY